MTPNDEDRAAAKAIVVEVSHKHVAHACANDHPLTGMSADMVEAIAAALAAERADVWKEAMGIADAGEAMKDSCWHCGAVLVSVKPRCEDCPAECDEENCSEMGCAPDGSGALQLDAAATAGKEK